MGTRYSDLIAWQKSMALVTEIYLVTRTFPKEEQFGLVSQLRRAAVSVPSNIAEGQARYFPREFLLFLSHARGSLVEVETQLMIASNLSYIPAEKLTSLLEKTSEISRLINALRRSIDFQTAELGTRNSELH
jgi:four helix bundle protein